MGNLVKYGTYTLEDAERDAEEAAKSRGSLRKFQQGTTTFRILPPLAGKKLFRLVHEHYLEVGGFAGSFVCAYMEQKKPCKICGEAKRLKSSGNPIDYTRGDEMYPRKRIYVNGVDRKEEVAGPVVFVLPSLVHEKLVNFRKKFPGADGDFTHPEDGYDIIVERTGTGKKDTRYDTNVARRPSPLCDDLDLADEWIQNQADLERFARLKDDEEVEAVLNSGDDGDDRGRGRDDRGRGRDDRDSRDSRRASSSSGRGSSSGGGRSSSGGRGRRAEDDITDAEYTEEK